jgi:hypothetical protein
VRRYIDERMSRQRVPMHEVTDREEGPLDIHELINKFFRRRKLFFYIAVPIFLLFVISHIYSSILQKPLSANRPMISEHRSESVTYRYLLLYNVYIQEPVHIIYG